MSDTKPQRQIEYLPPSTEIIEEFARNVRAKLAETAEPLFDTGDVADEFGNFLKAINRIYAKNYQELEKSVSKGV